MVLRKADEYQVDETDPWKNDKLDRKKIADYLTPVIASVTQPFTISIHSPYGTGKTSFVKSWQADLRKQGYKTVYFNAWETDFSQDAFIAFMAAIQTQLWEQSGKSKKVREAIKKATKKGVWSALKGATPKLVKGVAQRVVGDEAIEAGLDILGLNSEQIADVSEKWVETALESQEAQEKSRETFRAELEKAIAGHFSQDVVAEKKKLIVFIDDLDRCRPPYAVSVLEAIKHFLSVPGLVFVASIDRHHIEAFVRHVYGPGADPEGYLRKFFEWDFMLPEPSRENFMLHMMGNADFVDLPCWKQNVKLSGRDLFVQAMVESAEAFEWSLRKIERVFTEANLVCRLTPQDEAVFSLTLARVLALKHITPGKWLHLRAPESQAILRAELEALSASMARRVRSLGSRYIFFANFDEEMKFHSISGNASDVRQALDSLYQEVKIRSRSVTNVDFQHVNATSDLIRAYEACIG
jgi:hypothetical protein